MVSTDRNLPTLPVHTTRTVKVVRITARGRWATSTSEVPVDGVSKRVADTCAILITAAIIWGAGALTLAVGDVSAIKDDVQEIKGTLKGQETRIRAAELEIARNHGAREKEG
ncbi:MAG: hypothetical protein QGI09_07545 [Dehalococcoidia bacterium]|jgi:hypothetical protein|nr:hypothetical protein [Dehalococcoidia bacterium]|tara:strand:- start:17351 stop:17686 length:336 start_codon:yes stop_codon:yes gene_type:complete